MITGKDIYEVVSALVPLYAAMVLAYGSVRWWHVFTPEQCSGINRFVAVFAVPLLSFHFISANDPYTMNYRFIAADSLQKAVILAALALWHNLCGGGDLDWTITLFSLSTLPNTLVMGIPLLRAMYGDFSASLMVQIVVMQSVVWYTLMLFMFEYRGAKALIAEQFPPGVAGSIASIRVESDVVSLNGREPLQADAEVGRDGKIHVVVRRSAASSLASSSHNKHSMIDSGRLAGVEIYSVQSSPRASSFNEAEFYGMFSSKSLDEEMGVRFAKLKGVGSRSAGYMNGGHIAPNPVFMTTRKLSSTDNPSKDLHMYVWSSSASPESEANLRNAVNTTRADDLDSSNSKALSQQESNVSKGLHVRGNGWQEIEDDVGLKSPNPAMRLPFLAEKKVVDGAGGSQQMPSASVVTRLILIMVWRKLIRNPNTYSSLLGLVWSLVSFRFDIKMPKIVQGSISILSDAGLGMAMFSLGLFMALQPKIINCGKSVATFAMAVRFLTGPAVIAATSISIGIRGVLLHVAIVQAALPQGIVPFVFAKEYNCHPDILSTAVIFGMLVALPVTIVYYILLGLYGS